MTILTFKVVKVLIIATVSALISFLIAPLLIRLLNKWQFWKKEARKKTISGEEAKVFYSLHKDRETKIPRGGGLLIWTTCVFTLFLFLILGKIFNIEWLKNFNFLSRKETWLPLFTLVSASLVGLADDILQVFGKGTYIGGGLSFFRRMIMVILIGLVGGWWFYEKLGWSSIYLPFLGEVNLGLFYILLFVIVMLASWAGGIVDGIDGLAGGVFMSIFGALSIIAFSQSKIDLAAFGAAILGSLFAFLWYNIPPAKFYMGETGILGLTSTMTVFAFLTDSVAVLPIIAGILVIEVGSVILQLLSKKFFKRKIWLATPIHHHFEAQGWPHYQIAMRFWLIGIILALLGIALRLSG
jgi:phospho-N-acetylmuramoyl-pentapeptide-transferase